MAGAQQRRQALRSDQDQRGQAVRSDQEQRGQAVDQAEARPAVRPGSLAEASELLRDSAADGRTLLLRGGGTKLDWGAPVHADLTVDARGLDRLVAHNAADMTAEVGAGMRLAHLQEALGEAGQWLAVDPPAALETAGEGPTVGGIMAAGDAGPRRLQYGSLRDLVIGVTVVLADGTVAQSGGHVIKNVAGYDLAKLFCGSLGTLGLITQVVIRLHPRPQASRTVRVTADAEAASGAALALMASPVEPAAVEWIGQDASLLVLLEGSEAGVAEQAARVRGLAGDHKLDAQDLEPDDAAAAWQRLAAGVAGADTEQEGPVTVARASTLPDRLPVVAEALTAAASGTGAEASLTSSAALGLHTAVLRGAGAAEHATVLRSWRTAVERLGGTVTLRRRAAGVDELVDAWGTPPSATALMRRVKRQLDPADRCGPGRFAPWW